MPSSRNSSPLSDATPSPNKNTIDLKPEPEQEIAASSPNSSVTATTVPLGTDSELTEEDDDDDEEDDDTGSRQISRASAGSVNEQDPVYDKEGGNESEDDEEADEAESPHMGKRANRIESDEASSALSRSPSLTPPPDSGRLQTKKLPVDDVTPGESEEGTSSLLEQGRSGVVAEDETEDTGNDTPAFDPSNSGHASQKDLQGVEAEDDGDLNEAVLQAAEDLEDLSVPSRAADKGKSKLIDDMDAADTPEMDEDEEDADGDETMRAIQLDESHADTPGDAISEADGAEMTEDVVPEGEAEVAKEDGAEGGEEEVAEEEQEEHHADAAATLAIPTRSHSSHAPPPPPAAVKALLQLELKFAALRDKLYLERMEEAAAEEEMLLQGSHPALMFMQRTLLDRRVKLHEVASRRHQAVLDELKRAREADKAQVWTFWTDQRDEIHWEEFAGTWSKRRRLAREKNELETQRLPRTIPKAGVRRPGTGIDWTCGSTPTKLASEVALRDLQLMEHPNMIRHHPQTYSGHAPATNHVYNQAGPSQPIPPAPTVHANVYAPTRMHPSMSATLDRVASGSSTAHATQPRREGRTVPTTSDMFESGPRKRELPETSTGGALGIWAKEHETGQPSGINGHSNGGMGRTINNAGPRETNSNGGGGSWGGYQKPAEEKTYDQKWPPLGSYLKRPTPYQDPSLGAKEQMNSYNKSAGGYGAQDGDKRIGSLQANPTTTVGNGVR